MNNEHEVNYRLIYIAFGGSSTDDEYELKVFCDVTQCSLQDSYQRLGLTCVLLLQGRR